MPGNDPDMTTIAYVSCAGSKAIHVFRLEPETGVLVALDIVPVPGSAEPSPANMPLAFAHGGTRLYAALRSVPFPVAAFAVDQSTGGLTPLGVAPLPAPMAYITTADAGRLLMGASYKEGKLSVSRIGADGAVQAPPTQVLTTPPKAHCIIAGRTGAMVYATTVEGDAILGFHLDATAGQLVPAEPPSTACRPGSGPRHLALHPRLDILYCVNELAGTLAAFAVEPETGALREMQCESLVPPDFQGNARAAELRVTADGRFAYASVRNTNSIVGFRIAPDSGALTLIGRFPAEGSPRGFALERDGRWLICAGQTDNTVGVYAIDPASGALAFRHRLQVGANPNWVEVLALP